MTVALIIIAVLIFLLFSPTYIVLKYIGSELTVYIRLWYVVKIRLFNEKKKTEKVSQKNEKKTMQPHKSKKKIALSERLDQLADIFRIAVKILRLFCKHFTMYRCCVKVLITGEDPADVATEFGLVNAAAYGIISFLNEKITIKKKEILIGYEYIDEKAAFEVDFRFRVILLKFLIILICTNIRDIMSVLKSVSQPQEIQQEVK